MCGFAFRGHVSLWQFQRKSDSESRFRITEFNYNRFCGFVNT
nr:MAG TPA: hypothetical protein [Caudoviricetes sp.]